MDGHLSLYTTGLLDHGPRPYLSLYRLQGPRHERPRQLVKVPVRAVVAIEDSGAAHGEARKGEARIDNAAARAPAGRKH